MENVEYLDCELGNTLYAKKSEKNYKKIWDKIKNNNEVLTESIKKCENEIGEVTLKALFICEAMLLDYENIDATIYQKLVNLIYSDEKIARTVIRGGLSFLLMTLLNPTLKLSEEQKSFAVKEAMYKSGTIFYDNEYKEHDIDNTYPELLYNLSKHQAHGTDVFDIRYHILKNNNWHLSEKQKLVYDFYASNEVWDETLEQFEWGIISDRRNYKDEYLPQLSKDELYEYDYKFLLDFYQNIKDADEIWNEIEFCKLMHIIRPQKWEQTQTRKL